MIHDLDDTIKELMIQKVPIDIATVDITFDMPTKEWEAVGLVTEKILKVKQPV